MMSGADINTMDSMDSYDTSSKLVGVISIRPALKQNREKLKFGDVGVNSEPLTVERSVRFGLVEIREYPVVLGDHPGELLKGCFHHPQTVV